MSTMPHTRDWDELCRLYHRALPQLKASTSIGIGDWCKAMHVSRATMHRKYRAYKEARA